MIGWASSLAAIASSSGLTFDKSIRGMLAIPIHILGLIKKVRRCFGTIDSPNRHHDISFFLSASHIIPLKLASLLWGSESRLTQNPEHFSQLPLKQPNIRPLDLNLINYSVNAFNYTNASSHLTFHRPVQSLCSQSSVKKPCLLA